MFFFIINLEILELNFYGLNRNTRRNIIERESEEKTEINKKKKEDIDINEGKIEIDSEYYYYIDQNNNEE